jgi:hypothetical protein
VERPSVAETGDKGLKKNAIGFLDGLSVGLASTAPAYSLAAAFYYMNRVDTDCGTTFSWVTRALGPYAGWIGGWAICTTGILVVGSLADVSAFYLYDLLGLTFDGGKPLYKSEIAVAALAVAIIGDDQDLRDRHRDLGSAAALPHLLPGRRATAVRRRGVRAADLRQGPRRLDQSGDQLAVAIRGRVRGVAHRPVCWRCSSSGAGRAQSTSPRRAKTPRARPGSPGSRAPSSCSGRTSRSRWR